MQIKRVIAIAVCSVSFGSSAPVWADIVDVTYTGTVTSGVDSASLFGSTGQNLTGFAFSASYSFDTLAGGHSVSTPDESASWGGSLYGNGSPNLSAALSINGNTFSFVGDLSALIQGVQNSNPFSMIKHTAQKADGTRLNMEAYDYSALYPSSIVNPYSTSLTGAWHKGVFTYGTETLYLDTSSVTITSTAVAPVPEPETYAMMLAGLGLLGVATRRRKQKSAA